MKILLIDNYDSFTFNLYHYISSLKINVDVKRNDKITINEIIKNKYQKIVISPGPGNPYQSGNCISIVKYFYKKIPILGVCLGHQIIGQVFGSKIIQAKKLMHGKTSKIISKRIGILKNIPLSKLPSPNSKAERFVFVAKIPRTKPELYLLDRSRVTPLSPAKYLPICACKKISDGSSA